MLEVPNEFYHGVHPANPPGIYNSEGAGIRRFVSDIRDGRPAQPDFEDGWRAQQLVDAALRSSRERAW
jgi:predicted dehydrogenase